MRARRHNRGFTLIEVLAAMLIIAVGMLGIAKMQAMSYASTGTASYRSLAAIEAASLAAAMRANRNYWTGAPGTGLSSTGVTTFTVTNGRPLPTATSSDGNVTITPTAITPTLTVPPGCAGTVGLSAYAIAGCDLSAWAGAINKVLPVVNATVTCAPPAAVATVTQPIGCTIVLSWTENQTGINSQSQQGGQVAVPSVNGAATTQTNYTLYVEP
jgi:type IV pilus assembly protein PilV